MLPDASAASVCAALAATLVSLLILLTRRRRRKLVAPAPYSSRDFLVHEDLVDQQVRGDHLAFNAHLRRQFGGEKFVPVRGEDGCFIAFDYATCKEVMSDAAAFSSNPFPDGRLVALNTMSKADHTRVLRYVHGYYTQAELERLEGRFQEAAERCTAELDRAGPGADVMVWAKRLHMASTLLRLGVEAAAAEQSWDFVDEVVELNDAMVALVAPLGGVGKKYETLPPGQLVRVLLGLFGSVWPMLSMVRRLGLRCTWEIVRPDSSILWPPERPRMGLWWHPELLPLVPRYFLSLQDLLEGPAAAEGPLAGIREGVAKGDLRLEEALTLMVQLMVNMTSANALGNMVFRLCTEREVAREVFADPDRLATAFVQEVLRFDAPLQRNPRRVVQATGKWAASPLRPGDQVLLFLGAANRDPAAFERPDEFRLDRPEKPPALSFGSGMHYCLGSSLVKLEMRLALRCLLKRFESVELGGYERLVDVDVGNWGFRHLQVTPKRRSS